MGQGTLGEDCPLGYEAVCRGDTQFVSGYFYIWAAKLLIRLTACDVAIIQHSVERNRT